jgi:hypothetical protein
MGFSQGALGATVLCARQRNRGLGDALGETGGTEAPSASFFVLLNECYYAVCPEHQQLSEEERIIPWCTISPRDSVNGREHDSEWNSHMHTENGD